MPLTAEALALMAAKGLTIQDAVEIAAAMEPVAKPRSAGAVRQARYRENKKTRSVTSDVTSDASRDVTDPPYDINSTPQPSLRSVREQARAVFDAEFWPAYPRKPGNPRQEAEKRFVRLIEGGEDPGPIVAGAKAYATAVAGKDPQFTCSAAVFLNQRRWLDDHSPPAMNGHARAGPAPPSRRPSVTQAVAEIFEEMSRGH